METEEKNNLESIDTDENQSEKQKKQSVLQKAGNSISSFVKKGLNTTKNGLKKFDSKIKDVMDKYEVQKVLNNQFENEAILFTCDRSSNDKPEHVYVLKKMDEQRLYAREKDELIVGTVIHSSTAGDFDILESSSPKKFDYPFDQSSPYPLELICYRYETHKDRAIVQNINNQTVSIAGDNNGDIFQTQKMDDLRRIKEYIDGYKPFVFKRKEYAQVVEMYGKFENCVVNGKKDKPFFDKFVSLLNSILPTAATLAAGIISSLH